MRSEKPLQNIIFHTVATTDNPVIQKPSKTRGNVFATDLILATLMSYTHSMYSWDIDVQRFRSKLFLTRGTTLNFTVSGTANESPQVPRNSFNSSGNLAMEATYIDHNFFQQCLRMGREIYNFPNPNPFVEDDMNKIEIASIVCHYLRWKIGDDMELIFRYEHNYHHLGKTGKCPSSTSRHSMNGTADIVMALTCVRSWTHHLVIIGTELKNNSYNLAW